MERTTCCVIGGGPAGMVLGLLLARSGVDVTVLEKHGDFLRDFRGDTVHPTTLDLLDELGLGERFAALNQRRIDRFQFPVGRNGELVPIADLTTLPIAHNYIAMVPQWDLLDLLAEAGRAEPTFTLRMHTEATEMIRENGRVNGVQYRTADGNTGQLHADLTVACDGRASPVRDIPELGLREFPCPFDAWWFRLPRDPEHDPYGLVGAITDQAFSALIDRGDYWQCAYMIPKGSDATQRAKGLSALSGQIAKLAPWMGERAAHSIESWDEVKLLDVRLDRLRRWHLPGLLCLGDAAHAMSPIGGIGINLAVQDAVAAARILSDPLRTRTLGREHVVRVQRRRWPTTALVQRMQHFLHTNVMKPALSGELNRTGEVSLPLPLRMLGSAPTLRKIPGYVLSYGARREKAPSAALRAPDPAVT